MLLLRLIVKICCANYLIHVRCEIEKYVRKLPWCVGIKCNARSERYLICYIHEETSQHIARAKQEVVEEKLDFPFHNIWKLNNIKIASYFCRKINKIKRQKRKKEKFITFSFSLKSRFFFFLFFALLVAVT